MHHSYKRDPMEVWVRNSKGMPMILTHSAILGAHKEIPKLETVS